MKRALTVLLAGAMLALSACGSGPDPQSPEPSASAQPVPVVTPQPTPEYQYTNPLTGEPCASDIGASRPIAVMLNNLKKALPQHGVAQADIIFEIPAEGGITRMMGVFQSLEGVGEIGSVRSARPYYVELAHGLDAIFLHAGGSPDAYSYIKSHKDMTALDCVNGPYEGTLFWRDKDRIQNAGYEHSVFTSGEVITELFQDYSFRKAHEEDYVFPWTFVEEGTPAGGGAAAEITVPITSSKTTVFQYDSGSGQYAVEEYGAAYVDGNSGQQVTVTNVLILATSIRSIPGDSEGRLTVDLTGGTGWYACGGRYIPIQWEKGAGAEPLLLMTESGTPLELGQGTSYISVVSTGCQVVFEE